MYTPGTSGVRTEFSFESGSWRGCGSSSRIHEISLENSDGA